MKRKGVSPVIGGFMLIVVTIFVAVPLFGFTFGNLSVWSKPAEVMVSSSACGRGGNLSTSCSFTIMNLGASDTQTVPTVILYVTYANETRASVANACKGDAGAWLLSV